jgi:hypothetical protein
LLFGRILRRSPEMNGSAGLFLSKDRKLELNILIELFPNLRKAIAALVAGEVVLIVSIHFIKKQRNPKAPL